MEGVLLNKRRDVFVIGATNKVVSAAICQENSALNNINYILYVITLQSTHLGQAVDIEPKLNAAQSCLTDHDLIRPHSDPYQDPSHSS